MDGSSPDEDDSNDADSDISCETMAHELLKEIVNAPRSVKWSVQDDAILLVNHWNDELAGSQTRWHVKGHSTEQATIRLQELQKCLSSRAYNLWPDAPAGERNELRPMLKSLTSSDGRQRLNFRNGVSSSSREQLLFRKPPLLSHTPNCGTWRTRVHIGIRRAPWPVCCWRPS